MLVQSSWSAKCSDAEALKTEPPPPWLQNVARARLREDFVALKFDVDNDFSLGPTMEWGFLADLLRRPEALALVDELFVELHFFAPSLRWVHLTHSMKQAFDVLRQLRACGLPVHAWP